MPIAALGIVVWLGVRHFVETGPTVTVSFSSAQGISADDTKVKYKGMEVGKVTSVELGSDRNEVIVELRMDGDMESALNKGTRFWIVGGNISLSNLSEIRTVVSGPYIQMDPGSGEPARRFQGLDRAPVVTANAEGTRFVLRTEMLGSISEGTPVYYRGLQVGVIEGFKLVEHDTAFDITAFVRRPYDTLVHESTRFWDASAVHLALGGQGISAKLVSVETLTSGGIAFGLPQGGEPGPAGKSGAHFKLYEDEDAATAAPIGPSVDYVLHFDGAVGELKVGAPVKMKGFRVGEVTSVRLRYDPRRGVLQTPVTIALSPSRILDDADRTGEGPAAASLNRALERLIARGLRARLDKSTPVIGGTIVDLAFVDEPKPAELALNGPRPEIPTAPSDDLSAIKQDIHGAVAKIENLPLNQIGEDVRKAADRLNTLMSSPEMAKSLDHLEKTLAHLDRETAAMSGKVGPTVDALREAAGDAQRMIASADAMLGGRGRRQDSSIPAALHELSEAARSIRSLADYLDRHPEALIHGREGGVR